MYLSELIKSKTSQAQILDEANRVHLDAAKKLALSEMNKKEVDEKKSIPQVEIIEQIESLSASSK